MCRNVASGRPAGVQRDDLLVESGEPPLVLGDQRRLKAALAIPRNRQLELAAVGEHRLRARAVAVIAGGLFRVLAQMYIHLGVQNPFRERLLQVIEQIILLEHRLAVLSRQQLVQQLLLKPEIRCHTILLSSRLSYGSKPKVPYTLPGERHER